MSDINRPSSPGVGRVQEAVATAGLLGQHTCTNEWSQAPDLLWCAVCGRTLTDEEVEMIEISIENERARLALRKARLR